MVVATVLLLQSGQKMQLELKCNYCGKDLVDTTDCKLCVDLAIKTCKNNN